MSDTEEKLDDLLLNDPEMVANFIAESKEHLDSIEDDFLKLEKQKDHPDQEMLNKVFRAIHSIKGAAGFLNLDNMTRLAHAMETLLADMRSGKIRAESCYIDPLLEGVDLLTAILDDVAHCQDMDISAVHARLTRLIEQKKEEPKSLPGDAPIKTPAPSPTASRLTKAGTLRGETVRIPVETLDRLMVQAGELVLVRNQHLLAADQTDTVSRSIAHRLDLVTAELQETIIDSRMQPIGKVIGKFPRLVREFARQLGKQIRIEISGAETELDKTILETIADPLTHLVRNCCSHGIEPPAERAAAGKPETGLIRINALHESGRFSIQIQDDGRGIDPDLIRKKVLQNGLKTEAELEKLGPKEILNLIFLPGFSTAEKADQVSGRGVGMDVVRVGIEKLGGTVELASQVGEGTSLFLRLPLTLAIMPALIVSQNGSFFAIPQTSVIELIGLYDEDVRTRIEYTDNLEIYRLRGGLLPLVRLAEVLDRPQPFDWDTGVEIVRKYHGKKQFRKEATDQASTGEASAAGGALYFAVLKAAGQERFGLIIDGIVGTAEIVVKPLHRVLKSIGIYAGATIMGNGKVALILDVEGIARHADPMLEPFTEGTDGDTLPESGKTQQVLLFKSGPTEQFAVPVESIRRIEKISLDRIERIGEREFITVDDVSIRVLRLDQALKVTPLVEREIMHLILPKDINRPIGILISELLDIGEATAELDTQSYREDGIPGSTIIGGVMTLFVDMYRMAQIIEPEWFGTSHRG